MHVTRYAQEQAQVHVSRYAVHKPMAAVTKRTDKQQGEAQRRSANEVPDWTKGTLWPIAGCLKGAEANA